MTESTFDWFVVREKWCSLAEKVRLISQANLAIIWNEASAKDERSPSVTTGGHFPYVTHVLNNVFDKLIKMHLVNK